ncbi:MAG: uncharacterized protein A8A55_1674 [Amphiamblys sp. WSBS2006]|nr:MAG: uncharacterized protein A8A55_1674 [Amphiamblys sp. WSBS2006]
MLADIFFYGAVVSAAVLMVVRCAVESSFWPFFVLLFFYGAAGMLASVYTFQPEMFDEEMGTVQKILVALSGMLFVFTASGIAFLAKKEAFSPTDVYCSAATGTLMLVAAFVKMKHIKSTL